MTQRQLVEFLNLLAPMRTTYRHNWTEQGRRESVADHSWRLALMPMLIEHDFPDVDINKVIRMCILHDIGESVTGDIPVFKKTAADEDVEKSAIEKLLLNLSDDIAAEFSALFAEMEELSTPEAKLYKALDNLEGVISHNEADITTWEPHEYQLQLTHGADKVTWSDWLIKLKEEIDRDTIRKIKAENPSAAVLK